MEIKKEECEECKAHFDCEYYIEEDGTKMLYPNHIILIGDEEGEIFCSESCKKTYRDRVTIITKKDVKEITKKLDKTLNWRMDNKCMYCKKDWITKNHNPFISNELVFCNSNCAKDYLFKRIDRLPEETLNWRMDNEESNYKCIDCGLEFYSEDLPNVCISCNGNVKDW